MTDATFPRSLFDSYNARALPPRYIAKTFVPSAKFDELIRRRHTILLGPRGSGKTTLLKMLSGDGLDEWSGIEANEYKSKIDYTGVYIPFDRSWSSQIAIKISSLSSDMQDIFSNCAFTTHCLKQLVSSIRFKISKSHRREDDEFSRRFFVVTSSEKIVSLSLALETGWRLPLVLPSLEALSSALELRLVEIGMLLKKVKYSHSPPEISQLPDYFLLDFDVALSLGINQFDSIHGLSDGLWAFLFDELELAPMWIRNRLIELLRSTNQKILFKLSMAPFDGSLSVDYRTDPMGPMQGHDYDVVPLWYPNKQESYVFCRRLFEQMVKLKFDASLSAEDVLGASVFDGNNSGLDSPDSVYEPGGASYKRIAALFKVDKSFRSYLEGHNIDINQMHNMDRLKKSAVIRKIISIATLREYFRHYGDGDAHGRSRKSLEIYSGATSVFAISEGNPRWFIGLLTNIFSRAKSTEDHGKKSVKVSSVDQGTEIYNAMHRFRSLIKSYPSELDLLNLIDRIGEFFGEKVLGEKFHPEPYLSLRIPSNEEDEQLLKATAILLQSGALILISDDNSRLITSLKGKRFRLSFLLAPIYRLPLTVGNEVKLSLILNRQKDLTRLKREDQERVDELRGKQRSLFEETSPHDE
jgi:hypothetical protein